MEKFQPFDYMPFEDKIEKKFSFKKSGNEWSGTLKVNVEVITPVIVVKAWKNDIPSQPDKTIIPASSIRGMLRAAAEILWNGTISVINQHKNDPHQAARIKTEWKASEQTVKKHCAVSNLFGFMGKNSDTSSEKAISATYASKLSFSDGIATKPVATERVKVNKNIFAPKIHPVKRDANGKKHFKGRRIYLAGRMSPPKELETFKTAIKPGTIYTFDIHFRDITDAQLVDLIRLIELQPNYYHAVGGSKAYGYGRIKMTINSIVKKDADYFLTGSSGNLSKMDIDLLLSRYQNQHEKRFVLYYELIEQEKFDGNKSYTALNGKSEKRYFEHKQGYKDEKVLSDSGSKKRKKKSVK